MDRQSRHFETDAVHGSETRERPHGTPIIRSVTFSPKNLRELEDAVAGKASIPLYGRLGGNQTVEAAERALAGLEGGLTAILLSSGMAAVTGTLLTLLRANQSILLIAPSYGTTHEVVTEELARFGIHGLILEATTAHFWEKLESRIARLEPRAILFETPTNPTLDIIDIARVVTIAERARQRPLVIVDNTFASPFNQRPLSLGADIVLHSATKYLGGHSDLMLGAIILGSGEHIPHDRFKNARKLYGAVPSPMDAYELLRSMQTLHLRVTQQNYNAWRIAGWLRVQDNVTSVLYPGLPQHPNQGVAFRQMRTPENLPGYGGMVSFRIAGGPNAIAAFCNTYGFEEDTFTRFCASLGSVMTILEPAAPLSHNAVPADVKARLGITDDLIRLSVGVENVHDIIRELRRGLTNAQRASA